MSFERVIIWGYPLNSHTHSFVHYGWYRAFKALGFETHWFHDNDYPSPDTFPYQNALVITEGYADENLPLHPSNIYFVHVARNPLKYLRSGGRFIDIRYHVSSINDCNYHYDLAEKTDSLQKIGSITLYEPDASDRDLAKQYQNPGPLVYEAVYLCWATDLLPDEIQLEDRFLLPASPPVCHFIGSASSGNYKELDKLARGCQKHGLELITNNPWSNPLSFEEARRRIQESTIAPDIRGSGDPVKIRIGETGTCHKQIGYIPCRLFKNISYGKVGGTNCPRLRDLFGDMVVFSEDEEELVALCMEKEKDKDYICKQMEWVRDNHTYLNRARDLMEIVNRKN